jgi:hypothetical protein
VRQCRGEIWLTLRRRWADGTTHLRFDPLELLERLAVLTPRPRIKLILYYGVLAPRAAWRAVVVASAASADAAGVGSSTIDNVVHADSEARRGGPSRSGGSQWAELMRRTFGFDVLACLRCGERLRLTALIEQALVVQRILRRLGLPTATRAASGTGTAPATRAARESASARTRSSTWRGEDVASRRTGVCGASFLSPGGHAPWYSCAYLTDNRPRPRA